MKNLCPTVFFAFFFLLSAQAYDGENFEGEGFDQPIYEETEVFDEAPQMMPMPGVEAKEFEEYEAQESYDAFEPVPEPYDDYGYGGEEAEGEVDYY